MRIILLLICLISCGCTSARVSRSLASGAVGCPPEAITIKNETVTAGSVHNFTATCEGMDYFCTYMYPNPINCKPASQPKN